MELINKELIFIDVNLENQEDVFNFIADKALQVGLITNSNDLVDGFKQRELESSTGFEDGFAIPHARVKTILKPAVVVVRTKNGIDWKSNDEKSTNVLIALIVPENGGDQHMTMLSEIATKLMDKNFKEAVKKAKNVEDVYAAFNLEKSSLTTKNPTIKGTKNILAITACVVGVAHTYLAEQKLIEAGNRLGYNVRVETHGSKGVGTPFTSEEIKNADAIIFAVDTGVDKSRFSGIKSIEVKVAEAIKKPENLIKQVLETGTPVSADSDKSSSSAQFKQRDSIMKHILVGVSYMVPIIVLGGICLAFSLGIAKSIGGPSATPADDSVGGQNGVLNILNNIGSVAFALMIPILGGFIANSIAGRAAIVPAMVASFVGNNTSYLVSWIPGLDVISTPMGFIGAIIAGLLAGYIVKWINTWNIPNSLRAAMPIFFIPLVVGILLSALFIYVIGAPIGWVMGKIQMGIGQAYGVTFDSAGNATGGDSSVGLVTGLFIGLLLGAMGGFDMGGPINKIAFLTCSAMIVAVPTDPSQIEIANTLQKPMGALSAAIPVAPLGMGITTLLFSKFFDVESRQLAPGAIIMGCIGISEGAIPFAIKDPKRAVVANVVGSAIAGAIAGAFGVQDAAAHGGPIVALLGAIPYGVQTLWYFVAVVIGVTVSVNIYGFWLMSDAGKPGSLKERHVIYLTQITNEYKENVSEVNEQISALKNQKRAEIKQLRLQNEDFSSVKQKYDNEISDKLTQIQTLKQNYINKKQLAKQIYKEILPKEKEMLKTQHSKIKKSFVEYKTIYVKKLDQIVLSTKNKIFVNNAKKREFTNEIKRQKQLAKQSYQANILNAAISRHKEFVGEYDKKVVA